MTVPTAISTDGGPSMSVDALAADEPGEELPPIGAEDPDTLPRAGNLFDPATTSRVVITQNVVPAIATVGAYLTFRFVPLFGF
jgi:PiT family inorganic phosphate transporter